MKVTKEMYLKLFNGITDALEKVKDLEENLKKVQIEAEEMYVESGEEENKVVKLKLHK